MFDDFDFFIANISMEPCKGDGFVKEGLDDRLIKVTYFEFDKLC